MEIKNYNAESGGGNSFGDCDTSNPQVLEKRLGQGDDLNFNVGQKVYTDVCIPLTGEQNCEGYGVCGTAKPITLI